MVDVYREIEILHRFRDDWQSMGWCAEVEYIQQGAIRDRDEYRATLISPNTLRFLLDQDHAESLAAWNNSSPYFRNSDGPPARRNSPNAYQMYDAVWSIGDTATKACGGAILVARRLYPGEMPTAKQFKHTQEAMRPF